MYQDGYFPLTDDLDLSAIKYMPKNLEESSAENPGQQSEETEIHIIEPGEQVSDQDYNVQGNLKEVSGGQNAQANLHGAAAIAHQHKNEREQGIGGLNIELRGSKILHGAAAEAKKGHLMGAAAEATKAE